MKKRIRMIIMALLICVCVIIPAVSLNAADESGSNSSDACVVVEYADLEEVKDYLAGKNTYPTKEGYLFAGWYTTNDIPKDDAEALKYAVRNSVPNEGPVYALFVPASVLDVKAQLSSELLNKEAFQSAGKGSIRFVTTVNSLLYQKVGFEVSYVNSKGAKKSATSSSNKVYDKLYAVGSITDEYMENGTEYLPTEFSAASKFFKACNLKNVPASDFGVPITVKPFWVTLDGSKVYGETVIKSMDDYYLKDDVYVSDKGSDEADGLTKDTPFATLGCALELIKNQGTIHVVDSYTTTADFVWEDHNKTVNITGGELDFTTLPKKVLRAAQGTDTPDDESDDVPAVTANVLDINDSVTFMDTSLKFANGQHVYANGNTVEIASAGVTWSNSDAYIEIYGGSHSVPLNSDTNLILGAGQYTRVFGGGNYDSPLKGNVNITLSGSINPSINYKYHNATQYAVFGGGQNKSSVEGDITLDVQNDTVLFQRVYGGGNYNQVYGDINLTFAGKAFTVYGGGFTTKVTGDIYLTMTGGWTEQIFGGCSHANVNGNTNVNVQGGEIERRVYGGCYNELDDYGVWKEKYYVTGHTNVAISPKANVSLSYIGTDLSIYAISRGEVPFENEWGAFIFNETSYEDYELKLGHTDSTYDSRFSEQAYHYLIKTNGNTEDGSLGTVTSDGDYIRIKPRRGNSATIDVEGNTEHYTESETVFKLPELSATTDVKNITVTFETIDSNIDKSNYEARIDGAYYESLAKAIEVAPILNSKDTVTVTLLKDIELASQINIETKIAIQNEPGKDITIYRGTELATTDMFNVTSTGTLTLAGVGDRNSLVFDGRTQNKEDVESTGSLIKAAGNLNISNITIQYAKKTGTADGDNGGAIYSTGANSKLSIVDSTFSYNKSGVRGGAIYAEDTRSKDITISGCIFEHNQATNAGGAICIGNQNVLNIVSSEFIGNTSDNFGGAVAMRNDYSTVNLSGKVTFDGNIAKTTGYGGGAIMTGSVLSIAENANVTIKNNETKGLGGGIYFNAKDTPEFILGEGAILTMSNNKDSVDENAGTYRNVDIAIKNGGKAAEFNLDGAFDLDGIDTTIGTKITLGVDAQDSDLANITTVMLKASNDSNATVQEGDRLVYGSEGADAIFNAKVGDVTYNLDANGYLVGLNPIVELRQENLTRQFASLDIVLSEVTDGDTIALLRDITLNEQLVLDKSVTITTDGEADRIISCGVETASDNVVLVTGTDINVIFKGTENSQLIFDATDVILTKSFISVASGTAENITMQYVTMQNIASNGAGAAVNSAVPLNITNCKFNSCASTENGGAVCCEANLTVQGCEFNACSANGEGGAVYATGNFVVQISDSTFIKNESTKKRGGAICVGTKRSNPINISGCTFEGNIAKTNGGAIRISAENKLNITDSTFNGNVATTEFGGAVAMGTSSSELNLFGKCIFSTNKSSSNKYGGGGAIFAPKKLNVKADAWVEMSGNKCSNSIGNAICVQTFVNESDNGSVEDATFVIEKDAALYVWDNPSSEDTTVDDICITGGTSLTENENTGFTVSGSYGAWKPVAKIGNVGYQTLENAIETVDAEGEIQLVADVTLEEQLTIAKSVIISTDGVADRTIYCGREAAAAGVVISLAEDKKVTFKGASESSQLIFDGNEQSMKNVFVDASGKVTMKNVTMQNIITSGSYGAAVCITSPATIENCSFINCSSTSTSANGGAIYVSAAGAGTHFADCHFDKCSSGYRGGAIQTKGAITVTSSQFTNCHADNRGGAICCEVTEVMIDRCTFGDKDDIANGGNTSGDAGGAIHVQGTYTLNIKDSSFYGNKAAYFGGAVSFSSGSSILNLSEKCIFRGNVSADSTCTTEAKYADLKNYQYRGGAIMAPANLNIEAGAWVEMHENECKYIGEKESGGDAICINTTNANVSTFKVGEGASLYIYNNPSAGDVNKDICIQNGADISSFNGTYSTSAPTTE